MRKPLDREEEIDAEEASGRQSVGLARPQHGCPVWWATTSSTATPRRPSSSGRWPRRNHARS